jgi:peptide/nickel transport system substrate-binding protein
MSLLRNIFNALSRMERRVLWVAAAFLAVGIVGVTFLFIKNNTVSVPAHSGAYSEGMVGQPSYVNPVLAATEDDQSLVRLIYASVNDLADSIDTSADGRTIQVHLKQNLIWSDGQPLNSDDIVFTLQSIQNPDSRSSLAGLFEGVKVDRVSALQVDFHIENIALSSAVLNLRPAPKHLYGDIPSANWRLSNYNLKPVASGPYAFSSHDAGADGFINAYRLVANNSYAGTKPYLQKVNFLFFHNETDMLSAFNNGQVQGFGTNDPGLLDGIKRPYDLNRFSTPTVYSVFWNQTTNPALGPIEVRWALNLATDRNKILAALNGYGQVAKGPLPPALEPRTEPTVAPSPSSTDTTTATATTSAVASSSVTTSSSTDPAKILERKDWKKGDDGIWTKKISKTTLRLEFTLTVPDIGFLKDAAQELATQWEAFGAKVNLKVLPPDASLMTTITNRSYDGLLFGNTVRGVGDLYPFWHSSERFAPGLNLAVYKNTKVDALLEGLRKEKDPTKRETNLKTVSGLIANDEPAVFLFSIDNLYVSSKNLEGVAGSFLENPADRLGQLPQWYVNTTRKLK